MSSDLLDKIENRFAGRLAGRLAGRVQASDGRWVAQVVSWIDLVDLCRELDDSLMVVEHVSEEQLSLHQAVLNLAIGCGSWLLHQLRQSGADISASGQTMQSLDASLELLHILYRSRHHGFTSEEVEAARQRIFNAAA